MRRRPCSEYAGERTYDGEPAMKLESTASGGRVEEWDLSFSIQNGCEQLSSRSLLQQAFTRMQAVQGRDLRVIRGIAVPSRTTSHGESHSSPSTRLKGTGRIRLA